MKLTDTWSNGETNSSRWKDLGYWEFLIYIVMVGGYNFYYDHVYARGYEDIALRHRWEQAQNFAIVFLVCVMLYMFAQFIVIVWKNAPVTVRRVCAAAMLLSALGAPVVLIGSAVSPSIAVPDAFSFVALIVTALIALRNGALGVVRS